MPNWQTATQLVMLDTHRSKDPVDVSRAEIAVTRALGRYAGTRFWFNETWALFECAPGQQEYERDLGNNPTRVAPASPFVAGQYQTAFPKDLEIADNIYVSIGGATWTPLYSQTQKDTRFYTPSDSQRGYPSGYSWYGDNLFLYPVPSVAAPIRVDYMSKPRDLPVVTAAGGSFLISIPSYAGQTVEYTEITDDYTTPLLEHAMDLITARARWEIYSHHHDDNENAMKEGQLVEDALSRLRRETANRKDQLRIQPTDMRNISWGGFDL